MKKYTFFLYTLLIYFNFSNTLYPALESKILAKVENQLISSFELKNKIKLLLFLTNQQINQTNINNTKREALESLINLKLKKVELSKFKIAYNTSPRADKYVLNLSKKYNTDLIGLKNMFDVKGIDYELFFEEIKIEMAWQKIIYNIYKDKININNDEIDKELKSIVKNNEKNMDYKLSEIEILIDNNLSLQKKIEEIKKQIIDIGFENTAIKFSSSSSAFNGGDLGWINSSSLSQKVFKIINNIQKGEVSEPIIQGNSILFLKLIDVRKSKTDTSNLEQLKKKIVSTKQNDLLNLFSNNHLSKIRNNALIEIK